MLLILNSDGIGFDKEIRRQFRKIWKESLVNSDIIYQSPMEKAFKLIKNVEKHGILNPPASAIIVIGTFGTGKTTLCKYIARFEELAISEPFEEQFVVHDGDFDKIGDGTSPKTIFPTFYPGENRFTGYYLLDSPPYTNVNESFDVVSKYFMYLIVQRLEKVKVVITIDIFDLEKGRAYEDAANFLKNKTIIKSKSVGLIVTKFVSKTGGDPVGYIKNALKKVKNSLPSHSLAYKLINQLLKTDLISYLPLVQSPSKEEFKDHQLEIKYLIMNKMKYFQIRDDSIRNYTEPLYYFDFQLQPKTKNIIHSLREILQNEFSEILTNIKNYIINYYNIIMKNDNNYIKSQLQFSQYNKTFSRLRAKLKNASFNNLQDFSSTLLTELSYIRIVLPRYVHIGFINYFTCFIFLNNYSGKKAKLPLLTLQRRFREVQDYLIFTSEFYGVLTKLFYQNVTKSTFAKPGRPSIIVKKEQDTDFTYRLGTKQGLFDILEDLILEHHQVLSDHFLEVLANLNSNHFVKLREEQELSALYSEYNTHFEMFPSTDPSEYRTTFQISGFNLDLLRIREIYTEDVIMELFIKSKLPGNINFIKRIELFALDTITINMDIRNVFPYFDASKDIAIISPKWDITKNVIFKLDGNNAKKPNCTKCPKNCRKYATKVLSKKLEGEEYKFYNNCIETCKKNRVVDNYEFNFPAKNSTGIRYNGQSGKSGTSASAFLGIAEHVNGADMLSISSTAGNGSAGCDGMYGTAGRQKSSACSVWRETSPSYYHYDFIGRHPIPVGPYLCHFSINHGRYESIEVYDDQGSIGMRQNLRYYFRDCSDIEDIGYTRDMAVGCIGEYPTHGGHGGKGGDKGFSNEVKIINLIKYKYNWTIKNVSYKSHNGKHGKGAVGGKSQTIEEPLYYLDDKWCKLRLSTIFNTNEYFGIPDTITTKTDGERGTDGGHSDIENDKENFIYGYIEGYTTMSNFKKFARDNLINKVHKREILRFYKILDNNTEVKQLYDLRGYFKEFISLEKQFHRLRDKIYWPPFYLSLLQRLNSTNSAEGEDLHRYLTHNVLVKISYLLGSSRYICTINITNFINEVLDDIENYKKYQETDTLYKDFIHKLIQLQIKIIESKAKLEPLTDQYNNLRSDFYIEFDKLVNKIEDNIEEGVKNAEKCKEMATWKTVYTTLGGLFMITSNVASIFGPIGGIVGTVADIGFAGITFIDTIKESEFKVPECCPDLPPTGQVYGESDSINGQMSQVMEFIKRGTDLFSLLKDKIDKVDEDLFNQLQSLGNEIVEDCGKDVTKCPLAPIIDFAKDMKTLYQKYAPKISEVADFLSSTFEETFDFFQNNMEKIETYASKAEQWEAYAGRMNEIRSLVVFEIMPQLARSLSSWINFDYKTGSEEELTKSFEDISQFIAYIADFSKNLQIENNLQKSVENLIPIIREQHSIRVDMIRVLQQIQICESKVEKLFGNDTEINNTKPEFRPLLIELRPILLANLVMDKYQAIDRSMRQVTFPYADDSIIFKLPDSCAEGLEVDKCVQDIINNIKNLKVFIQYGYYRDLSNVKESNFVTWPFENETDEFYAWKNVTYRNEIRDLLSGKAVYLYADIMQSRSLFNAVKFNGISVKFVPIVSLSYSQMKVVTETLREIPSRHCEINMTHLGISIYMCENKYFELENQIISFRHLLHTAPFRDTEAIIEGNPEYQLLSQTNYSFSPFAYWKFQIECDGGTLGLEKMEGLVDLHLEGHAEYLQRDCCPAVNTFVYPEATYLLSSNNKFQQFSGL